MTDALRIEINAFEVTALAEAWRKAPEIVVTEMVPAMLEAELLLEREIVERTPRGAGGAAGLAGSFAAGRPRVQGDSVVGEVGSPLPYAVAVELGTRPHFPPIRPIAEWARVVLGLKPAEAEQAAFNIARAISKRGTKGAFMAKRAVDANQGQVEGIFARGLRRILARLAHQGTT